jgi:oxygen-independent coproporphyrinogen III oxidase
MLNQSPLMAEAARLYAGYRLDELPPALQRNSLDYYYLSIYPSLMEMRPIDPARLPPYPPRVNNAYIHIPFCSGVCDFCSYYLVALSPRRRDAVSKYLYHVSTEFDFHARHTTLNITYLYFGGGTPSLIPPQALQEFLGFLRDRGYLDPAVMGTLELHPEFFADEGGADRFLNILRDYGINRVSIGYQASDEDILRVTNRRHTTEFMAAAMTMLRDKQFLVNVDLMYGLADQSLASWEATLADAVGFAADSIATYFLFVDRGTGLYERVRRGSVKLPHHRHILTQHLMAQIFLERAEYYELPNDFWARGVVDPASFRPERLPSSAVTLPIGPGAYGHYNNTQLANLFDLDEYTRHIAAGRTPLWRAYPLTPDEAFHRDVMFAFKNDPFIDCNLFLNVYNRNPLQVFTAIFERLQDYDLVQIEGQRIHLTSKGRLCVEEISSVFRHPGIQPAEIADAQRRLLEKHNFAPTYPAVMW